MQGGLSVLRGTGFAKATQKGSTCVQADARFVTPDRYWIFLAFSKASSIVPTM
jgi:hypothetical protein